MKVTKVWPKQADPVQEVLEQFRRMPKHNSVMLLLNPPPAENMLVDVLVRTGPESWRLGLGISDNISAGMYLSARDMETVALFVIDEGLSLHLVEVQP